MSPKEPLDSSYFSAISAMADPLQCSDTIGWATGRAYKKAGCWLLVVTILPDLASLTVPWSTTTTIILSSQ